MVDELKNIVEAALLATDGPLSVTRIQRLFDEEVRPEASQVHEVLQALKAECDHRGVELRQIGSGYRYQTREKYADYVRRLHAVKPPRLSRALLETLAIIAYQQPATRGDIEAVRGVTVSTDMMQRLIERGWIKQVGVRDVPGHPALFGTTAEFLSYFNLKSLKELPSLAEKRDGIEEGSPLTEAVLSSLSDSESIPGSLPTSAAIAKGGGSTEEGRVAESAAGNAAESPPETDSGNGMDLDRVAHSSGG